MTAKPRVRKLSAARRTRWIPAALRRDVWRRDQGRCSFVGEDGHRCNETRGLEFAHVKPWAKGFGHSVTNLCLRCIAHNAWEAERDYGTGFMATKRQREPLKVREPCARHALRREPGALAEDQFRDVGGRRLAQRRCATHAASPAAPTAANVRVSRVPQRTKPGAGQAGHGSP